MTTFASWQYIDNTVPSLLDPRYIVSKHMAWYVTNANQQANQSPWTSVEPDCYNYAIFDTKPHDLEFVNDQCFYKINQVFKRNMINGWMSLYFIEDKELLVSFNREIIKLQPQAVWRNNRIKKVRDKIPLLNKEICYKRRSDTNFSTEERLYQMGYFKNLQNKYFSNDENFLKVVGDPRRVVLDYQPEVDDLGDSNYLEES